MENQFLVDMDGDNFPKNYNYNNKKSKYNKTYFSSKNGKQKLKEAQKRYYEKNKNNIKKEKILRQLKGEIGDDKYNKILDILK